MKVRGDFVTNSSSSSFCHLSIKNNPLAEMLVNYDRTLRERGLGEFLSSAGITVDLSRGEISGDWDEWNPFENQVPDSLNNVLSTLCWGIANEMYQTSGILVGVGPRELVGVPMAPLVRAIAEHRDELEDSMESVHWSISDMGWGGDSDSRYMRSSYSPEMLADILQTVAEKKGCKPEEVTDYDFNIEVGSHTSDETDTFEFDRRAGKEERTHTFELI